MTSESISIRAQIQEGRKYDNKESAGKWNDDETEKLLIAHDNIYQQICDIAQTADVAAAL